MRVRNHADGLLMAHQLKKRRVEANTMLELSPCEAHGLHGGVVRAADNPLLVMPILRCAMTQQRLSEKRCTSEIYP
jgi:hypothetical protein